MAQAHDTTGFDEVLQEISESRNPLLTMLRMICQEFMELEVSKKISADRSERCGERTGYRSGYRDRRLDTRLGTLTHCRYRNFEAEDMFPYLWNAGCAVSRPKMIGGHHEAYIK